jgi:hypothetical protein
MAGREKPTKKSQENLARRPEAQGVYLDHRANARNSSWFRQIRGADTAFIQGNPGNPRDCVSKPTIFREISCVCPDLDHSLSPVTGRTNIPLLG